MNHLPHYGSNHVATRINLEVDIDGNRRKKRHIFRFEEVLSMDSKCEKFVDQLWNNNVVMGYRKLDVMQGLDDLFHE